MVRSVTANATICLPSASPAPSLFCSLDSTEKTLCRGSDFGGVIAKVLSTQLTHGPPRPT